MRKTVAHSCVVENPILSILRVLSSWNNAVELSFLGIVFSARETVLRCAEDVIVPTSEEKENVSLFANNVRRVMAHHLQLPMTEHSYEDVLLMVNRLSGCASYRPYSAHCCVVTSALDGCN